MYPVGDPVSAGLVASLARPGGNITGVALNQPRGRAKRLQILKEAVRRWPGSVCSSTTAVGKFNELQIKATHKATEQLGITMDVIGVRDPSDLEQAVIKSRRVDALVILPDPLFIVRSEWLASLALEAPTAGDHGLDGVCSTRWSAGHRA